MKNIKSINEFWGAVIRRDMSSATREEDKIHTREELIDYLKKEIEKQGKNVVIRNLDVSGIENLSYLFCDLLDGVETLDSSGWNLNGVKDIHGMFYECGNIKSLDLSGWDTSSVTDMSWMFGRCKRLKSLDLTGWDTNEVDNMSGAFYSCVFLQSLDLSGWDTGKVRDMSCMFQYCVRLQSLDLSNWDISSVEYMRNMFHDCPAHYKVVDNKIVRI